MIGALRSGTSGLGQALNLNGFFFYQLPSLYTQADLAGFKTIIIDRNALDRNVADVRTYHAKLLELAAKGATVIYLPQEDLQMLREVLPAGIDFAEGSGDVEVDESWDKVILNTENHRGIYSKKVGSGQFVYFEVNDLESLIKRVIPYTGHVK